MIENYQYNLDNFDAEWFRETVVGRTLLNSRSFQRKFKGRIEEVYWKPNDFLKKIAEYIWDKTNIREMDHWTLIFGYEGSGKSSFSIMLYNALMKQRNEELGEELDIKEFLKNDLIFMQSEYAKATYNYTKNKHLGKQHPIIIDDAHYVFGKYYGQTSETQSLLQIARFVRSQQIIHIINTQVPQQLFADIWRERVNTYMYCFAVDVMSAKTQRIKNGHLYVAFYNMETSQDLREDPMIRKPLFWRKILSRHPPDMITRFDVLFPYTTDLYQTYKSVKNFYAKFYQYLRYKGVTKGKYFELIFKMLTHIARAYKENGRVSQYLLGEIIQDFISIMPDQTKKKLNEYLIIWEDLNTGLWTIDMELFELAIRNADLLLLRNKIFSADETAIKPAKIRSSDEDEEDDEL